MKYLMVITAVPNKTVARNICNIAIDESLAACCQIIGPIESHYIWKNRKEVGKEYLCFMKTALKQYKKLEKAIKNNHPYEIPEIIAIKISQGFQPYLNWLSQFTK
jgi:periplasmic divalent cation tolerance protein